MVGFYQKTSPSRYYIIGQKRIIEIPPTKGQFRYSDHIHNQLKFLRSFPSGKLVRIDIPYCGPT
jgi:hypothetical protein